MKHALPTVHQHPTRRRLLLASGLLLPGLLTLWPPTARGQEREAPPEVKGEIADARMQGGGKLRFYAMPMYEIRLYTGQQRAAANWAAVPLALEIEYSRAFDGDTIADRSLKEMQRQADFSSADGGRWLGAMQVIFPDVRAGDRITGVQQPGKAARFYFNGQYRGEVAEALFTRLFFGIWLSARTSEPVLRDALLGSTP